MSSEVVLKNARGASTFRSDRRNIIFYKKGTQTLSNAVFEQKVNFTGLPLPAIPLLKPSTEFFATIGTISNADIFATVIPATLSSNSVHAQMYIGCPTNGVMGYYNYPVTAQQCWYGSQVPYGPANLNWTAPGAWWANDSSSAILKVDFGAGVTKTIKSYYMRFQNPSPYVELYAAQGGAKYTLPFDTVSPKNWTLDGSNNDSDWTVVDTRINQNVEWSLGRPDQIYDCSANATAYRYYRLNISDNNGHTFVALSQLKMSESAVSDMTYFKILYSDIAVDKTIDWAVYSFIQNKSNDAYGVRTFNSRSKLSFDSGYPPLIIKSVHDISLTDPTWNTFPYADVSHGSVRNPYYIVSHPGHAYLFSDGRNYAAKIGIKKLTSTSVRVGWFEALHMFGEVVKDENFIYNPANLKLIVCDVP